MTDPNNNKSGDNVEEVNAVQSYISKFFMHLYNETGFSKRAFTEAGLLDYVKNIAKNCFQLQIVEDILQMVIKIALIFSKSINGDYRSSLEETVEVFVKLLYKIANFLVTYFLGRGFLIIIAGSMHEVMVAFLIGLFYAVTFAFECLSFTWFSKLKDWVIMVLNSDKVKCFFEKIFPTYGRAITMY